MTQPTDHITTAVKPSAPDRPPTIWPTIAYLDAQAAIDFLVGTFGFEPTALIPSATPGSYAEIELRWPHGSGGVILREADTSEHNRATPVLVLGVPGAPEYVSCGGHDGQSGREGHSCKQPAGT